MKVEAILFDMDGVLVDVSPSYRYAIKKTAEFFSEEEIQFPEIQQTKNKSGYNNDWDCTHAIISAHGKDVYHWEIVDKFQELYLGKNFDGFIKSETWLLKQSILENLYHKYKLGIVTGRPGEEAKYVLNRFDAEKYFDALVTMDDTPPGKGKPEPYGLLLAQKQLKVKTAVYLGDTIDDMKAAQSAGIIPVGLLTYNERSEKQIELLKKYGAKWVLDSVNEITDVL